MFKCDNAKIKNMKHLWLYIILVTGLCLVCFNSMAQDENHSKLSIGGFADSFNPAPGISIEYSYFLAPWFAAGAHISEEAAWNKERSSNRAAILAYALFRPLSSNSFWRRLEMGLGVGYENGFKSCPGMFDKWSNNAYTVSINHLAAVDVPLRFYFVDTSHYDIGLSVTYRVRAGNEIMHGLEVGVQIGAKF